MTDEIRYALLLSPGDLLSPFLYERPLLPNKSLLYRGVVNTENAELYLRRGFRVNPQYQMAESLKNTLQQMLPTLSQVISLRPCATILDGSCASSGTFWTTTASRWAASSPR